VRVNLAAVRVGGRRAGSGGRAGARAGNGNSGSSL